MMFQATQDDLRSGPHAEIRLTGQYGSVVHFDLEPDGRGDRLHVVSGANFIDLEPAEIAVFKALHSAGVVEPVIISRF